MPRPRMMLPMCLLDAVTSFFSGAALVFLTPFIPECAFARIAGVIPKLEMLLGIRTS